MLTVEDAQERILSRISPLETETKTLTESANRILAAAVTSPIDLPSFDNSAMDGYAVVAQDLLRAGAENPVILRMAGRIAAGDVFQGEVARGACVRIFTGSPMPRGADAVVMQEDTRKDSENADNVFFLDTVRPWENVRLKGEDVKQGTILGAAGERLTAARIGVLAAAGVAQVTVRRRPVVGLLATGSELAEGGQKLAPAQVYESNRGSLAALVEQVGGKPKIYPIAKDTLEMTRASLDRAFRECDSVVTAGGVSVGEFDFVKEAFESLGGELALWRVAMKPGKPFVFGTWRDKFLFGLPGNPVSAFVTFLILVRPALLRLQGAAEVHLSSHLGALAEDLSNRGDRRHFMRVTVGRDGAVRSAGLQASHALSSLAVANGLVDVPPGASWHAGQHVSVFRWEL
ncbi:MAG: molybdopterin molybdotransferase MoeA [Verrucomicrobia bacterium]|nr:molybdopterin molybdotransferase MoeA [Verrucomicrobiota bacterium]